MSTLKKILKFIGKSILYTLLVCMVGYSLLVIIIRPSNDRDWNDDQAVLPTATINGDLVSISNIRNFAYASTTSYTPAYYDASFNIRTLKNVWFIVEPFSGYPGAAHTFLSFEFEGDRFISISVEIRKEKGESFSAVKGLFRQYELMYVIADERDVVKLRSNYRKDQVYVYPVKADILKKRALFLDMIARTNKLSVEPEFYNTLTNTCTTNIVSHVNKITTDRIPFSFDILFPENSDRLAYDVGLIDTDLDFAATRAKYLINDRAEKYADAPDFSRRIRE